MLQKRVVLSKNRKTGETTEVPTDKLSFRPSAYGVILKDNQVLLNQCWDGFDFPGGGIDLGESIHDGLLREVKEETGLDVTQGELLFLGEDFFTANFKVETYYHSLLYYFHCTEPRGEITTAGLMEYEKIYMKESVWMPLDRIDRLKFYNGVDSLALIRNAAQRV